MTQFQNTLILQCLWPVFVWLSFVSTSLAQKTHGHILQSTPLLFPRLELSEDGLRLLITHKCSWLISCDVCYWAVLWGKKNWDCRNWELVISLLCLFATLEHFGCVFQKRLYLHMANKSASGRFCHGFKDRGGNTPHILVSDNRLMAANVCWACPTQHTWRLRLTKIRKCSPVCKCMLYLYRICSNSPNGLHVCNLTSFPWNVILTRAEEKNYMT